MRRKCGGAIGARRLPAVVILAVALILSMGAESVAYAGFLKNGVRPGAGNQLQSVKPPRAGARDRIKAPGEPRQSARPHNKGRKQQHAWFWKLHTPDIAAASPTRWEAAMGTMSKRHQVGQRLSSTEPLRAIEVAYRALIARASDRHSVSDALIAAVILIESAGQPRAVSPKGAQGLMQLIPATATRFGVSNPFDTSQNIEAGAAYLSWLLKEFGGDVLLALAGYNAGEGAVRRHNGVPPYAETRDYVVKVMDAVTVLRTRCDAPLVSPRTRCVWAEDQS